MSKHQYQQLAKISEKISPYQISAEVQYHASLICSSYRYLQYRHGHDSFSPLHMLNLGDQQSCHTLAFPHVICLTHTNSLLCAPLSVLTWEVAFADERSGGRLPLLQHITPSNFFFCNGRLHFSSVHLSFSVSHVCHYAVVLINLVAVLPCGYCIYTTTSHLFFFLSTYSVLLVPSL